MTEGEKLAKKYWDEHYTGLWSVETIIQEACERTLKEEGIPNHPKHRWWEQEAKE